MNDTRTLVLTIVGTGVGLAVLLTGVMFSLIGGVNTRIDDTRLDLSTRMDRFEIRMDRIETRLDGFDERLRNVEIAFGKVDQRLLTIERVVLPGPGADQ
ncbi:MAG: hypothetical protein OXF93_19510 [Acidobacteria bacterium]|nr:hypothetical protein [Acidobacteriota bacterium]